MHQFPSVALHSEHELCHRVPEELGDSMANLKEWLTPKEHL